METTAFAPNQRLRRGGILDSTAGETVGKPRRCKLPQHGAGRTHQTEKSRTKQRESDTRWTMSTRERRNKRARKVVREPKPRIGERDLQARQYHEFRTALQQAQLTTIIKKTAISNEYEFGNAIPNDTIVTATDLGKKFPFIESKRSSIRCICEGSTKIFKGRHDAEKN